MKDKARTFCPVVVAPTFNNGRTLPGVLAAIDVLGLPVIVVNDGCDDDSPVVLAAWADGGGPSRNLVAHECNRGKAAALQSGFDHARELGFTHAVTIDTDGQ